MEWFKGKIVVITGSGSGLGRELAFALAQSGAHLALCDVDAHGLEATKVLCDASTKVEAVVCDVSQEESLKAFRARVEQTFGERLDVLINNAAVMGGSSFIDDTRDEWDKTFQINWGGVYFSTRVFMPMLMLSQDAKLVNISSIMSLWSRGISGAFSAYNAYCTSKAAIKGFTESLMVDLRLRAPNIAVSLVISGLLATPLEKNSRRILGKAEIEAASFPGMSPKTAAQKILEDVLMRKWRIIIGEDASLLDAKVRESPEAAYSAAFWRQNYAKLQELYKERLE